MKERPILFSGPMVRAILDGRKTQTRRVVKGVDDHYRLVEDAKVWNMDECGDYDVLPCPFGVPGDRLWVRETWGEVSHVDGCDPTKYEFVHVLGPDERNIIYREEASRHGFEWLGEDESDRWRPSIHMPRWASRITLEVVSVRVERLQEMTERDAIDEGAMELPNRPTYEAECAAERAAGRIKPPLGDSPLTRFARLWDSLYGEGAWEANPWVWVVEFKRAEVKQ